MDLTERLPDAASMAVGTMKMARVGVRRVVVVRTSTGFHALDNACPHEGYGLVTGALDGELLTCEWHNWKFDVADGRCVLGEEHVASHQVDVDGCDLVITVTEPSLEQRREAARESLRRGIDAGYNGQMARDSLRMLQAGADPVEIIWEGVARTAPRTENGFDHALAMTADCLHALEGREGDDRLLAVMQALSGMAEECLRFPTRARPPALDSVPSDAFASYCRLVEAEHGDDADALLTAALRAGLPRDEAVRWMLQPVCAHHLGFGHGAIYVQKAFELLDYLGWERAEAVLPHLTANHVVSTREDKLPYMRPFMRAVDELNLTDRWGSQRHPDWRPDDLVAVLSGRDLPAAAAACAVALGQGSGFTGIIDAVSLAASQRLLDHDLEFERVSDPSGYGWLDITHSLTYAQATRWAFALAPSAETARLALFSVFHVVDGGRYARDAGAVLAAPSGLGLAEAIRLGDHEAAVAACFIEPTGSVERALVEASLDDRSGAFIVVAHHIKTARAAIREAQATGSRAPLAAGARFLAAPARQRFVGRAAQRAQHFLSTGTPPPR